VRPALRRVSGRSDGQDMLEALERANLFLVPLDAQRRWWRFHHLFADLLRARLQRAEGARVAELHRRAAEWCERHGLIDETIRHALAAGDAAWAARPVEEHLGETLRRGESVILDRWLSSLPDEVVRSRSRLCLAQAMLEWHRYRLDEVERRLQQVEEALKERSDLWEFEVPREGGMVADLGRRSRCCVPRSQACEAMGSGRANSHVRRWRPWPSRNEVHASGPGGCWWPPTGTVAAWAKPSPALPRCWPRAERHPIPIR
jgi:hypothetical protein